MSSHSHRSAQSQLQKLGAAEADMLVTFEQPTLIWWPFQWLASIFRRLSNPGHIVFRPPDEDGPSHSTFSSTITHCPQATSSGVYSNWGQYVTGNGTINNIKNVNEFSSSNRDPLEELQRYCSPNAIFDSAARSFNPARCTESTRLHIMQDIEEWIKNEGDTPSSMFFLYGGAGAGKSAVAQSLSERLQGTQLAASFFFCKTDPSRNDGNKVLPTLISQLANIFEDLRTFIQAKIHNSPDLLTKRSEVQFQELLIEPLSRRSSSGAPRLIVIEGLNECQVPYVQPECELLRDIARFIRQSPYPFRFLITSRPEAHIMNVFNHDPDLQAIKDQVHRYNLSEDSDADNDIRKFLEDEFAKIRRVHPIRSCLDAWPDQRSILTLVKRSSKHFIYASTVIRYIQSPDHRPDERLSEVILRLRPPQVGDRPYAQLDAVYRMIFDGVTSRYQLEQICLALGILHFQSRNFEGVPGCTIEKLLDYKAGDLQLLLRPIISLVSMDGDEVRLLHKSALLEYLLDPDRNGYLPFDLMRAHEVAATYILKHKIVNLEGDLDDVRRFSWHCRFSHPNPTLTDHLQSLEVPFTKSFMTEPTDPSQDMVSVSIIWHYFRTLSRRDLYSTTHFYERYLAKWINHLHLIVPTVAPQAQNVVELKRTLDQLLMEWQPANMNPMDVGMDPIEIIQREDFIKKEHIVFSYYAKATLYRGNKNSFVGVTSLVSGAYFFHSYNMWTRDKESFLYLRTYSKHDDACYGYGFAVHHNVQVIEILEKARVYLKKAEKCLASNLYQKYGVMPEDVHIEDVDTATRKIRATETDSRSLDHQC